MTATTVRPGGVATKLLWTSAEGTKLNNGTAMTGLTATQYVRRNWSNHGARIVPGHRDRLETWPLDVDNGLQATVWTGVLPVPEDLHPLVTDLILDLPLSIEQGELLTKALEAAVDSACPDCPVCAPLRQLLASKAVAG